MSRRNVEIVIGRLVTDEDFRERFLREPAAELGALREHGVELTDEECDALCGTNRRLWLELVERIDPRLQKASLKGG